MGYRVVIFEGDCLILIETLQCCGNLPWSFMTNWEILLKKLDLLLWWEIRFCRSDANKVANTLSRIAPPLMTVFKDRLPPVQETYLEDITKAALIQPQVRSWL